MDFEQIYKDFMALARVGISEDGSVTRLLFSREYMAAAERAEEYMEEAGLTAWMDSCGNVHGVYGCGKEGAKTVYMGSHLDTVKQGDFTTGCWASWARSRRSGS